MYTHKIIVSREKNPKNLGISFAKYLKPGDRQEALHGDSVKALVELLSYTQFLFFNRFIVFVYVIMCTCVEVLEGARREHQLLLSWSYRL